MSCLKERVCVALAVAIIFMSMPTAHAVGTGASAAVLMEAETGRVLYEHNAHVPRLIASITKLMTALVALEVGPELQTTVTVAPE